MNKEHVRQIHEESKSERWPFPKTFEALKGAGVAAYRYDVPTGETVFMGASGISLSELPSGAGRVEIAPDFDQQAIASAIKKHSVEHTPFQDFRTDAARAGVEYWEVSMENRTVKYCGAGGCQHTEQVPQLDDK